MNEDYLKQRFPYMTLLLVLSCLISSVPQLFLSPFYSQITGRYPDLQSIYLITMPSFTHSPEIFINHLAGNLLVILIFGGLIELILGSSRFALITIVTFLSTTVLNYFHSQGRGITHGASGICFGYIVFFFFFVLILIENRNYRALKHPMVIFSVFLALFSVFGIPLLEIAVMRQYLFQNFGQTIHLLSYSSVVPFLLLWRKDFEMNSIALVQNKPLSRKIRKGKGSIIVLNGIFLLNLFSTIYAIHLAG